MVMTTQPYEGATEAQLRHPMVRELLGVHNMFRTELERMLRYIDQLLATQQPLDDAATTGYVQALIRSGSRYSQMLHTHHHLESTLMFPQLEAEGLEPSVVDRLNSEHDAISGLIDQFADAVRDYSAVQPAVVDSDLRRLADALEAHLAYEETHVCPVLAQLTTWN